MKNYGFIFLLTTIILFSCRSPKKEILTDPQIDATVQLQMGHYLGIAAIAFSPDGQYIASSGWDKSVRIWEIKSNKEIKVFSPNNVNDATTDVISLAFSPDGKTLVGGTKHKTIKIFDVEKGKTINEFQDAGYKINSVTFSPDGKILASGGNDKIIKLWDIDAGSILKTLKNHSQAVRKVDFNNNGKLLASASNDSTVIIWDVESAKAIKTLKIGNIVDYIEFSPDGRKIVCNTNAASLIQIWDVAKAKKLVDIKNYATGVTFTPDGKQIISVHLSETTAWDVETGKKIKVISQNGGYNLTLSPDGKIVATTNSEIEFYDFASGNEIKKFGRDVRFPSKVRISPTGRFLVTENGHVSDSGGPDILSYPIDTAKKFTAYGASTNGSNIFDFEGQKDVILATSGAYYNFSFYDLATANPIRGFEKKMIGPIVITPDGKLIIGKDKNDNNTYAIFDATTGQKTKDLINSSAYHHFSGISPDGKYFVLKTMDFFKVFELPSGNEIKSYEKRDEFDNILFIDMMKDEKYAVGDNTSGGVVIKDILTGASIFKVSDKSIGTITSASLSPDKKIIALACDNWSVVLYDIEKSIIAKTITGHKGVVVSVCFTPNGKYIVSSSHDKTTKIWDAITGAELLTIIGLEKTSDYKGKTKDYIVLAPNGRIDGTKDAIQKIVQMKKGTELLPVDSYFDKIYTPNLLGRTLGQDFKQNK